jgi:hypothetical protein
LLAYVDDILLSSSTFCLPVFFVSPFFIVPFSTLQQLVEPAHETRSHSNSLVSASDRLSERGSERESERGSERSSGRALSREGSSHFGAICETVLTPGRKTDILKCEIYIFMCCAHLPTGNATEAATTFATSSDPSHATTEVDVATAAQLLHKVVISDATSGTASTTDSTLVSSLSQGSL